MDPDANYSEQQAIHGSKDPHDRARLRELVAALRGWVAAGGFKPKGFVGPSWKPAKAAPAVLVKKVGGIQAQQALILHRLVRIDRASAERRMTTAPAITIAGDKVGAHAFFGHWNLAFTFSNNGRSPGDFSRAVNGFGAHLESELGWHVAFFVSKDDYQAATGKRV